MLKSIRSREGARPGDEAVHRSGYSPATLPSSHTASEVGRTLRDCSFYNIPYWNFTEAKAAVKLTPTEEVASGTSAWMVM